MKKRFIIHPFLFAVFPFLFIFSHNINEISFSEIIKAIIIILSVVIFLQSLLPLILLNKIKIALLLSLSIFTFFSYGHIYEILKDISLGGLKFGSAKFILPLLFLIFAVGIYFIIKTKNNLENITSYLNIISILLLTISLYNLVSQELQRKNPSDFTTNNIQEIMNEALENSSVMPDIYYIILDAYTSSSALKEIYNYDNSDFENYLSEKGFYIASESRSNYAETRLSLASSLNMQHLNLLGKSVDVPMLYQMIDQNKVMQFLKMKGYKIINLSSTNVGKIDQIKNADLNFEIGSFFSVKFQAELVESTILSAFKNFFDFAFYFRKEILSTFSLLSKIRKETGEPHFIFAHILSPHPPYVFGPNGEPIFESLKLNTWGNLYSQRKFYVGQLTFVNKMIKNIVADILSSSEQEPIIIIQGDHGPTLVTKKFNEKMNARMRIFNASYFPQNDKDILYKTITPVNTFRVIFNYYFKTSFELLEDKSYFTDYNLPYEFLDVTDEVVQSKILQHKSREE